MSGHAITLPPYGTRGKARKDSGYTFWLNVNSPAKSLEGNYIEDLLFFRPIYKTSRNAAQAAL